MEEEQINLLDPILRAKGVKVFWNSEVNEISQKGALTKGYLIITNPCIYFCIKRVFPSGYKIARKMPTAQLISVTLTTDFLALQTKKQQIVIGSPKINEITATIVTICNALFGDCNFLASTSLKIAIEDLKTEYETKSLIGDKFVACCCASQENIPIEQIIEFQNVFTATQNTLIFTPSLAASTLMSAIKLMLHGHTVINTIILNSINFSTFSDHLKDILANSDSLENIIFYRATFMNFNDNPSDFFRTYVSAPLTSIVFRNCDLTSSSFKDFFYGFRNLKGSIKNFSMHGCKFSQQNLECIFYSIFDYPCFKTLQSLSISECNCAQTVQMFLIQLMNCDWILKNKNLKRLALRNIAIDTSKLLSSLMLFESGLEELTLSDTPFGNPLPAMTTFQQLTVLDLSHSVFTNESLLSLFTTIASVPPQLIALDLSYLKMNVDEAAAFYLNIKGKQLPGLRTLVWDGNIVRTSSAEQFVAFLISQRDLIDLSVSDVFPANLPNSVASLCDIVTNMKLARLVVQCSGMRNFGEEFSDVLRAVEDAGTVTSLDVTGQSIRDGGVRIIERLARRGMAAIAFGNTLCDSYEVLEGCLSAAIDHVSDYAIWPGNDVKRVITKVPLQDRDAVMHAFSGLKKRFDARFPPATNAESAVTREPTVRRKASIPMLAIQPGDYAGARTVQLNLEDVARKEDDVKELLELVLGEEAVLPENDPMVKFFKNLQAKSVLCEP